MNAPKTPEEKALPRTAEALFNFPRLYRAKFALTGAILNIVRPLCFKEMVREGDLLRAASIPSGSKVCEIGCGDGNNYKAVKGLVDEISYTGIDINPAMIAHCEVAFPEQRWKVSSLPYPFVDKEFDFCIIINVLHHLNSRADSVEMLREAKRISNRILLFEPLQSENPFLYRLKQWYWAISDGGFHYQRLSEFHALFRTVGLRSEWEKYSSPLRHFYAAVLLRSE